MRLRGRPVGTRRQLRTGLQYQWSFFAASELEPPLNEIARQLWGEGEPDEYAIAGARGRFAERAAVVAAALEDNEFLVDDRFSVADLTVGAVTGFAKMAELAELPATVDAYVVRLEAGRRWSAPAPGSPRASLRARAAAAAPDRRADGEERQAVRPGLHHTGRARVDPGAVPGPNDSASSSTVTVPLPARPT